MSDAKDWYMMTHLGLLLIASTVFVFLHPQYFPQWGLLVTAVGGIAHYLFNKAA